MSDKDEKALKKRLLKSDDCIRHYGNPDAYNEIIGRDWIRRNMK